MSEIRKILIVEDSNLIRVHIKSILAKYKVEVFELNNADDLFSPVWQNRALDLLILDINLPGMNGLTALKMLRENTYLAYLPVIILSGHSDAGNVQKALKLGAINFVCKPFTEEDLLARIEQVIGPLVLPEEDIITNVCAKIHDEISRAKRGNTVVSFIKLQPPVEMRSLTKLKELVNVKNYLANLLRETDSILLTDKRNLLLILPFTEENSINIVIERIRTVLNSNEMGQMNIQSTRMATLNYPKEVKDESDILATLQERLPHGELIG